MAADVDGGVCGAAWCDLTAEHPVRTSPSTAPVSRKERDVVTTVGLWLVVVRLSAARRN
jgi:hypothetical protein